MQSFLLFKFIYTCINKMKYSKTKYYTGLFKNKAGIHLRIIPFKPR